MWENQRYTFYQCLEIKIEESYLHAKINTVYPQTLQQVYPICFASICIYIKMAVQALTATIIKGRDVHAYSPLRTVMTNEVYSTGH